MKIILDRGRIDSAGMVVAINSVMREVTDQINMLSEQLDEDTLIAIEVNLCTRKYFEEQKDAELADEKISDDEGGSSASDIGTSGDGYSEGKQDSEFGEAGTESDAEPADLTNVLDADDDPLGNVVGEISAPKNNQHKKKHGR